MVEAPVRTGLDIEEYCIYNDERFEARRVHQWQNLGELTGTNYVTWKWQMLCVLEAKGLQSVVKPTDESKPNAQDESMVKAILCTSLSLENQRLVVNCEKAFDVWKRLEEIHENKTTFEKQALLRKLHNYKISSPSGVAVALAELQTMASQLGALGEPISDDALASIILNALPKSFESWLDSYALLPNETRTLSHLIANVSAKARSLASEVEESVALFTGRQKWRDARVSKRGDREVRGGKRETRACHFCKKVGHIQRDCWKLKQKNNGERDTKPTEKPAAESDQAVSYMAVSAKTLSHQWFADSGASYHMCMNRDWFSLYEDLTGERRTVRLGDGSELRVAGRGVIDTDCGKIENCLHVPELTLNLMSIGTCIVRGFDWVCSSDMSCKLIKDGKVCVTGRWENRTYVLDIKVLPPAVSNAAYSLQEWHQKLGHISPNIIVDMAKSGACTGLEIGLRQPEQKCLDCLLGKCTRVKHTTRTSPRAQKPGQALHMDTIGPLPCQSLGGCHYYLLASDEFSAYKIVDFVVKKSDIADRVKQFVSLSELETGNFVLKLKTDNGTEFVNQGLRSFLESRGIVHLRSAPHVSEQNGLIERQVRIVSDSARTMLVESQLPEALWAEAVNTSVYVNNRVLRKGAQKTPYELWSGRIPNLSNLHTFR